jgi:pimeloyl-ACP methyl ester carboxylesterase
VNTFVSFDGIRIAYHDEGEGPAVILLHGFGVDGLGQFGDFERILPILEKRQEMFREVFGGAPPLPNPPLEGRPGVVRALQAAGARTILPDMRGFGAFDKPREKTADANSAMARDVIALIDHLRLDAVDLIGFSNGGKDWPVPDSVPRPITRQVWAEEGATILEQGEIVPGHLASATLIAARATGADPRVLAAVIRGAVAPTWPAEALRKVDIPIMILNGKADVANQKIEGLLQEMPTARSAECNGDHHSTPYQPTFHQTVVRFFEEQWRHRHAI